MSSPANERTRVLGYVQDFVSVLHLLRGPVVISLVAFAALSVPAATREAYRTLAEEAAIQRGPVVLHGTEAHIALPLHIWTRALNNRSQQE